jgi:hypothetical protein
MGSAGTYAVHAQRPIKSRPEKSWVPNRQKYNMDNQRHYWIKRNIKDSIFVNFFSDRENVFKLYTELHPEDTASTPG